MSIKDSHSRKVSFDTREELGDKIDKLALMIGKLATRSGRQLYHGSTKAKVEDKIEVVMIDAFMISEVIRIDIDQKVKIGDSTDKIEVDPGMHKITGEDILEVIKGCIKILKDKTVKESIEIITEMKVMVEVVIGTGIEEGHLLETLVTIETIGVQTTVGPGQDQELVQIETG